MKHRGALRQIDKLIDGEPAGFILILSDCAEVVDDFSHPEGPNLTLMPRRRIEARDVSKKGWSAERKNLIIAYTREYDTEWEALLMGNYSTIVWIKRF